MRREYLIRTGFDGSAESKRTLILNGRRWRSFNTALGEWSRARGRKAHVFQEPRPKPPPPLYCRSLVTIEPPRYAFEDVTRRMFLRETWPHGLFELLADVLPGTGWLFNRLSEWWTARFCAHEDIETRPLTIEASYEIGEAPPSGPRKPGSKAPRR